MSTFKTSGRFHQQMEGLRRGIDRAANEAMSKVVKQAEKDAQRLKRWHDPGTYSGIGADGDVWVWEVTGATAASITGYVVGKQRTKALNPARKTTVERHWFDGDNDFVREYPHTHDVDAGLMGQYSEQDGVVQGVVTMYTAYAPYLQRKERAGALWGSPSSGLPVTIQVFEVQWQAYYVPNIVRPTIEKVMAEVAARYT